MGLEIRENRPGDKKTLRDFLGVTKGIYAGDRHWVRPLDMEIEERLDPKKNPFFEHAEGTSWVAYRDGKPVGRMSAQIDREHLAAHKDDAGFFGFLDTTDDAEVCRACCSIAPRPGTRRAG
jgi:hypothetical protein